MLASFLTWLLVLPALAQAGTFDAPVINVGGAELKKILREDVSLTSLSQVASPG